MMICKADFEELFPATFRPEGTKRASGPDAACINRWEDDGGRPLSLSQPPVAPAQKTEHHTGNWSDPRRTGLALAMMPAIATLGAAHAVMTAWRPSRIATSRLMPSSVLRMTENADSASSAP